MDDATRDSILAEAVAGRSVRAIAAERDISVEQVRRALDDAALAMQKGDAIRADIAIEKGRLDELLRVFYLQAKTGDVSSGALYEKLSGRKASLLGYNAPQSHAIQITRADAPPAETSTEYYIRMLDRLDSKPPPAAAEGDELPN
jgi:hypothetical protein